jgi:hypothetical protein
VLGHERLERRDVAKKDVVCGTELGPGDQILQQCVARILRQPQADFVTPFPHDSERASFPLKVGQPQSSDVACTQAQSHQEQQDRAVMETPDGRAITGRNHARDLFCREGTVWQGREPPMGEARQRLVWLIRAQPVEAEKPQERPDRGDQVLGRARTRPLGPIEHECHRRRTLRHARRARQCGTSQSRS